MPRKTLAGIPLAADGSLPRLAGCDPVADTTLREDLKSAKDRVTAAEADVRARKSALDAAKDAYAKLGERKPDSDEFRAMKTASDDLAAAQDHLEGRRAEKTSILEILGESTRETAAPAGDPTDPREKSYDSGRWNSGRHLDEAKGLLERAATTKGSIGTVRIGQVASRDTLKADVTGTSSMRRGSYAGTVPQLRRPLTVLDLMPTGITDGNSVPYTQQGGTYAAAEVAESALKPESGVTFTDVDAPVRTIAAWQKLPKQTLADVAAMQSIIDDRLRYEVQLRLESEVVSGNGTSPNLQGILNTTGIGSVTYTTGALVAEQILGGITNVMVAFGNPNGVLVHPSDWQKILTAKASGSGEYLNGDVYGGPFGPNGPALWGVPIIPTQAVPSGTALVGDWALGAQLFIREGVNVLVSDSDQDDFLRNRVTILAEMRAALAVWRPSVFCKVALA